MSASDPTNPYAPPESEAPARQEAIGAGRFWRVEGDKLLVRDGAVLPDVCITSGATQNPGRRVNTRLSPSPFSKLHAEKIRISFYRTYRGVFRETLYMAGGPVLGTVAAVVCSEWMVGDGSATKASISISFGIMILGFIPSAFLAGKRLRVVASHDGWHELQGIHPAAIRKLGALLDDPASGRGEATMPSTS